MKKKIIGAVVLVAVIALIIFLFTGKEKKQTIDFETEQVTQTDITDNVTATGTIEPVTKVEVGTQVSGIVNHLYVDYNSVVKKGQVIAELDKTNLMSELENAKNNLASTRSELSYQTLNYNRMKELHSKGLISDNDYDNALLTYNKAKDSYHIQQQNVSKAQTNLSYATITSPIDGVVLSKAVEEGQTVAASFSTPTLFTIAKDLTDMRVIADVDEADIGSVKEGQNVTFTVDAYPDDTFHGTVQQVRQEATVTSNVVTYEVVISAPNNDLKLKPGLTANVSILTMECHNTLAVASKALRFSPNHELLGPEIKVEDCQEKDKVWTLKDGTLKAHPVKTGVSNGTLTQIISGVPQGTEVITEANITVPTQGNANNEKKSLFTPGPPNKKK